MESTAARRSLTVSNGSAAMFASHSGMHSRRRRGQSGVIVAYHEKKGAAELMRFELGLRVEPHEETLQVVAILQQLPPAEHLHQWEKLHAGGTDSMWGGRGV